MHHDFFSINPCDVEPGGLILSQIMLFTGGGFVLAAIIALVLFFPRGKMPVDGSKAAVEDKPFATSTSARTSKKAAVKTESSSVSVTQTTPMVKTSETKPEHKKETIRAVSARADDILFTVTGMKVSGGESILIVRAQNQSDADKEHCPV